MDAILFSANPSLADMDDAVRHLEDYPDLYWTVGFPIDASKLSFPLLGFIHVSGRQVEYRAIITKIVPFKKEHYEDNELVRQVKPESFLQNYKRDPQQELARSKTTLVISEISPFSFETKRLAKYSGGLRNSSSTTICPSDTSNSSGPNTITGPNAISRTAGDFHSR